MKHILSLVVSLAWSVTLFAAITITPASRTFDKDGKGGAILTAGDGTWTASTTADWITITPNTSGNAGESVVYIVNANLSADTRVGTIIVSGNTHTITQTGYDATIDPASATFNLNGGEGTVNVTTLSGISWTAKSNVDWITLDSTVGLGNGSVTYTVAKNDSVVTRTGTITLAGNTFSVTQTGVDVTLSPTSTKLESTAQVVLLTITALTTTSWTVTPNVSWISVVSGGSGSGGGSAALAVAANPSWVERTGTVSVGSSTLTVKQKGTTNLSFSITPETATAISDGAYGNVAVVATPDAPWSAQSETSWITLSSGQTGAGNGNIQYVVSPNTTLSERTGTIRITPPVAEPEIDLYSGLLFWIKDQTNIEGNETRQTSLPLSTVLDGSKAITFTGEGIPTNSTSSFSFAVSFKIGELNRINRLFELGIGVRSFYVDAQNRLHYDYAGNKLYERTIDWEVAKADQWYTILISQKLGQNGSGNLNVYLGEKGGVLARKSSLLEGFFVDCKTKRSLGDFVKLGQTRLPSSGYLGSGQFANVRFWNRALTEAECEAVDTMQNAMLETAPKGAPSGAKFDFLPLNGNMYGSDETGAIACKATASGWTSCEGRGRLTYRALQSNGEGKIVIDDFSNLFKGGYTTGGDGYVATSISETNMAINAWVKLDSLPASDVALFARKITIWTREVYYSYYDNWNNRWYSGYKTEDIPSAIKEKDFSVYVTSTGDIKISGAGMSTAKINCKISLGEWHMVTINVAASKYVQVFVDGAEVGNVASEMTLGYLPPLNRGHISTVPCTNYTTAEIGNISGSLDEVALYHELLAASDIRILYLNSGPVKDIYHTVTQSAATPSFNQTTVQVAANGGNASVTMTLTAGVNWMAKANSDWLTITDGTSGTGSATIAFTAGANPSVYERTGTLTVAGKTVKVVQAGWGAAVSYDESVVFGTDGGSDNVSVLAEANASWTATSDVDWITVALGASGSGNGTVTYVVSPYNITTASRTGTLTVAGKKVYITQRGYEMSIDPYVAQIGSNSGTSLITVIAPVGAIWEAIAKESWITITGGQSGSGSGAITYSVKENTTGAVRTGTIIIAGEVYRITQTYSLAVNVTTNGHGTVTGGGMYDCGTKVTLTATPDEGYYFVGWTGDVVGSDNPCTVTVDTAKNITAIFASVKPIVISNITYENLRGTTHANPATYQEETAVAFTPPSGTVTGYTFAGWTPNGITTEMTGDQTVTANWTANSYEVQFHANGGSGTMANQAFVYDAAQALMTCGFVKDGYSFVGWGRGEDAASTLADAQIVSNLTDVAGGVVELWAVWESTGGGDDPGVIHTPPEWTGVTKSDTMAVYATVLNKKTGANVETDGSLLAAFDSTGECRGVAEIEEGPLGMLFQLSVGINSTSETGFMLKVWDAATGEITEIAETFDANADKQLGAIFEPIVYEIGALTQDVILGEGWSWISFCLTPEDAKVGTLMDGLTFANGDMLKASDKLVTYYNGVWYPSSYALKPGAAYMVKKTGGGTEAVTVEGSLMTDGLALTAGWNWFGPTTLATQTISSVTYTGGFANNDQAKSSSKVATWYGGKWYSSDFQLCPGAGYVAKLTNAGTLYFGAAPSLASAPLMAAAPLALSAAPSSKPAWTPVVKSDNMAVYATIHDTTTDADIAAEGSVLAAFDTDGECRGVATIEDGPLGKVFQLPIGLESTSETGFVLKIWDASNGTIYEVVEKVDANAEKQIGQIFEPTVFTVKSASDPIPDLGENPTTEEITNVFVEAKAGDPKLAEKITTEAAYTNFSAWAKKVQPHGGGDAVGAAGVMAAPNAWVSYALGSETLLEAAPTDADLTVEAFEPKSGEDGKFDFTVSVKDVEVGGAATTEAQMEQVKENLKQVFGLEGGTTLEDGGMSSANVEIEFGAPQDGKVKFTAGPKDMGAKMFFMKVKVK